MDRFVAAGLDNPCILLTNSGDDYIRDSVLFCSDRELPPLEERPPSEKPPAILELALDGERWCDVTHRRTRIAGMRRKLNDPDRVWDIDDAVTENLDMGTLIHDYLSQLSSEECETAYDRLRALTVCDPTVGSGAFLFAAMDVLEPMYITLLDRATEIESTGGPGASFLTEARQHSSERYWLLKTICLQNLFGVDLMPEAVEIAKLRLFLKLVAQISHSSDVEPLPDLDFNIKAGNLLVGLASTADADRITGGGFSFPAITNALQAARHAGSAYRDFTSSQATAGRDWQDTDARQKLASRFEYARKAIDPALHNLHNIHSTTTSFKEWKDSHSPFHWFAEFPEVWRNGKGGFDVILGNPPYISKGRWKGLGYRWRGYKTQNCPDLYAPCLERASMLLNDKGRMAMIVMHSLCFNKGFKPLRDHLEDRFQSLWISSYAKRPDLLFAGSADVRNSIVVGSMRGRQGLTTTRCQRWLTARRDTLFDSLMYLTPPAETMACGSTPQWPFTDEPTVANAFARMVKKQQPLQRSLEPKGSFQLGYRKVATYWFPVFTEAPPIVDPITGEKATLKTTSAGWLRFGEEAVRDLALVMLAVLPTEVGYKSGDGWLVSE